MISRAENLAEELSERLDGMLYELMMLRRESTCRLSERVDLGKAFVGAYRKAIELSESRAEQEGKLERMLMVR